jgi:ABC-type glycerol-3-phosphate transport system substrate-binding protein
MPNAKISFFPFVCDAFYGDGEMYAIPFFVDPLLMIANKSMLRDDRIAVNDHPSQLWTGLLENGKKFERFYDGDKGGPPAVFLRLKKSEESHILPKILTTLLLQVEKKEALQKESLLEILTYLKELDDIGFAGKAKTSYARDAGGSMAEQFLDEKVAVYFGTHSDYKTMVDMLISKKGNVQKSDLEVYPPPRVSRLDSGIFSGESWAFAVSKNASDPGPSLAFLAFLTEETSHVTYSQNNGKISARRLVADRGVFREVGDASRVPPGQTGTFEFQKEFSEELLQMFSGNKTPEEVADFVLSYLPDYDS